ncbi:MAG: hypothetical protein LBK94_01860 [Prevotellaceae bacterium]|jgi:chromosome segregation ATPase|nr:hypothetical protein [Prevotellaceae bacterium]
MAENTEKKVLITANVVSNFVETKRQLDSVKQGYKDLEKELLKIEKEQGKNSEAYQKANAQLGEQAKLLATANNKYRDAKKELEGAARSQNLINSATQNADNSLRALERDLNALRNIDLSQVSEEDFPKISEAIAQTSKKIQTARLQIDLLDTSTHKSLARIAEGFQAVSASATSVISILSFAGVNTEVAEKLNKSIVTLIGATQALGIVSEYLSKQKYKLFLASVKNIASLVVEKAITLGTAAATLIMGKAADTASKSFKALRIALISTGIGALVIGVMALAGAFGSLFGASSKATKALKEYEKQAKKTETAVKNINTDEAPEVERRKLQYEEEILAMQKAGASEQEIAKKRLEQQRALTAFIVSNSNKRTKEYEKEVKSQTKAVEAQQKVVDTYQQKIQAVQNSGRDTGNSKLQQGKLARRKNRQNIIHNGKNIPFRQSCRGVCFYIY